MGTKDKICKKYFFFYSQNLQYLKIKVPKFFFVFILQRCTPFLETIHVKEPYFHSVKDILRTFFHYHYKIPLVQWKRSMDVKGSSWNHMPMKNFCVYKERVRKIDRFSLSFHVWSYQSCCERKKLIWIRFQTRYESGLD